MDFAMSLAIMEVKHAVVCVKQWRWSL